MGGGRSPTGPPPSSTVVVQSNTTDHTATTTMACGVSLCCWCSKKSENEEQTKITKDHHAFVLKSTAAHYDLIVQMGTFLSGFLFINISLTGDGGENTTSDWALTLQLLSFGFLLGSIITASVTRGISNLEVSIIFFLIGFLSLVASVFIIAYENFNTQGDVKFWISFGIAIFVMFAVPVLFEIKIESDSENNRQCILNFIVKNNKGQDRKGNIDRSKKDDNDHSKKGNTCLEVLCSILKCVFIRLTSLFRGTWSLLSGLVQDHTGYVKLCPSCKRANNSTETLDDLRLCRRCIASEDFMKNIDKDKHLDPTIVNFSKIIIKISDLDKIFEDQELKVNFADSVEDKHPTIVVQDEQNQEVEVNLSDIIIKFPGLNKIFEELCRNGNQESHSSNSSPTEPKVNIPEKVDCWKEFVMLMKKTSTTTQ